VILAAMAALVETGPGRWSLDAARGRIRRGTGWAIVALALGAAGSDLALRLASKPRPEHETGVQREEKAKQELLQAA
jgi:hypothetical protein